MIENVINDNLSQTRKEQRSKFSNVMKGDSTVEKAADNFKLSQTKFTGVAEDISKSLTEDIEGFTKGLKTLKENSEALDKLKVREAQISQLKDGKQKTELMKTTQGMIEGLEKNTSTAAKFSDTLSNKLLSFDSLSAGIGAYLNSPMLAMGMKMLGDFRGARAEANNNQSDAVARASIETAEKVDAESGSSEILEASEKTADEISELNERSKITSIQQDEKDMETQIFNSQMLAVLQDIASNSALTDEEKDEKSGEFMKNIASEALGNKLGNVGSKGAAAAPGKDGLIKGAAAGFAGTAVLYMKSMGTAIVGTIKKILPSIAKLLGKTALKVLIGIPLLVANMIKGAFIGFKKDPNADIGTKIMNMVVGMLGQLVDFVSFGLIDTDMVFSAFDKLKEMLGGTFTGITEGISNAIQGVKDYWENTSIVDMLKDVLLSPTKIIEGAIKGITAGVVFIQDMFASVVGWVTEWITDGLIKQEDVEGKVKEIRSSVTDMFSGVVDSVKAIFEQFTTWIKTTAIGEAMIKIGALDDLTPEEKAINQTKNLQEAADARQLDDSIARGKNQSSELLKNSGLKDTGRFGFEDYTVDDNDKFSEILKNKSAKELEDILAYNNSQSDADLSSDAVARIESAIASKADNLTAAGDQYRQNTNNQTSENNDNSQTNISSSNTTVLSGGDDVPRTYDSSNRLLMAD